MRNVLAHAGRSGRRVVFADQLRPIAPKRATLMDTAEPDVLADMGFPAAHRVTSSTPRTPSND